MIKGSSRRVRREPAKRGLSRFSQVDGIWAVARFARSIRCRSSTWGSASLHPRLYAATRFAGFREVIDSFLWSAQ